MNIKGNFIAAILMTIVTTVILGVIYPLAITGIAQVAFPNQANGQLIERNGAVIGSRIIGQGFSSPGYFHSRPSAAGTGYDAANSAGSQLGPTNKKLIDGVKANVEAARKENPNAPVPIDLVRRRPPDSIRTSRPPRPTFRFHVWHANGASPSLTRDVWWRPALKEGSSASLERRASTYWSSTSRSIRSIRLGSSQGLRNTMSHQRSSSPDRSMNAFSRKTVWNPC